MRERKYKKEQWEHELFRLEHEPRRVEKEMGRKATAIVQKYLFGYRRGKIGEAEFKGMLTELDGLKKKYMERLERLRKDRIYCENVLGLMEIEGLTEY